MNAPRFRDSWDVYPFDSGYFIEVEPIEPLFDVVEQAIDELRGR